MTNVTSSADPDGDVEADIRHILEETRTIAMVGASTSPMRPSYEVMGFLQSRGYRVIPVNPQYAGAEVNGERIYASLADVPAPFEMVDVFRASDAAGAVADEAVALAAEKGIRSVWMQIGVRDEAAADRARAAGLRVVMDRCPKIELARTGIHRA
jgi:predicted CoA-binding protein